MIMKAVLTSSAHPEYGEVTIPFPIPGGEYDHTMELLESLEIGDALRQNCRIVEMDSRFSVLRQLEQTDAAVDELDYLAKRLDSFNQKEAAQFQGMAAKWNLSDIQDFINLTFCCQETTVISDFSKLEEAGKQHYLTIHGGSALAAEVDAVNGKALAQQLIQSGEGNATPYGLFFRNGMRMEELYQGRSFPPYAWDSRQAELVFVKPDGAKSIIFLPFTEMEFDRFRQRENILDINVCQRTLHLCYGKNTPFALEGGIAELAEWNELCDTLNVMSVYHQRVFSAAMEVTGAEDLAQLQLLVSSLEDFELVPGAKDAESYGKYMIQDSGKYRYDPDLECYYNYEALGEFLMTHEVGQVTSQGYLKCEEGSAFLDFFTQDNPEQGQSQGEQSMQMGGM